MREHQNPLASRVPDFARQVQERRAQWLKGRLLGTGGEPPLLEPGEQIEGKLPNEQLGPVGGKAPGGQLLQPEAALRCFAALFPIGRLQLPSLQVPSGGHLSMGDEDRGRPEEFPAFLLDPLPLASIPIGVGPARRLRAPCSAFP